jgi:Fe-coproporphyrin III synthase
MLDISRLYCGIVGNSENLRYGPRHGQHAHSGERRPVVVWNCTRQCNLRCVHCYAHASEQAGESELTPDEGIALIEDLARFHAPVVLFSGGEPLLRPDLYVLADRAVKLGLRAVVSSNGTLVTRAAADRLRAADVKYVGISLDGMRGTNDRFRGIDGAFEMALQGIRNCLAAGLKTGLRFTITKHNVVELQQVFDLIQRERIPRVCFYHLVYAGRGSQMVTDDLGHDDTRAAVDLIIDRTAQLHRDGLRTEVLTVDNHADGAYLYMRMAREGRPAAEEALTLLRRSGANASGDRIGCVSWDGAVYADQFWRHVSLGNVRERPFSEIWSDSSIPLLGQLRDRRAHLKGRCAGCGFLDLCGGNFRVRAEAATGDLWAPDPACYLTDEEIGIAKSPMNMLARS